MDTQTIIIAIVGGFAAGIINTLAGNGSAITLSILTEVVGLPPNIANGTNRIGVLFQSSASSIPFIKNGRVDWSNSKIPIISGCIGAILGVWLAVSVSNEQFRQVFKYMLVFMFFMILIKPKRWLRETSDLDSGNLLLSIPLFFALGFYGGFIQMGMGVFFLVVTVLILRYNMIDANALKTIIVAIYTILVVAIFHSQGLIDWKVGGVMAIGQTAGGYLTAEFASKYKGIEVWAYRLLVVVVIIAILSVFGVI